MRASVLARHRDLLRAIALELGIVALAGIVYVVVRQITEGSPEVAMANAARLVDVEQALGIHHEQAIQAWVLGHEWLRDLANWIYIWGHWPVIAVVATYLWFTRRDNYARLRNAVITSGLIGFLLFALVPMAPPRLTDFGFVDTVTVWSNSYRVLQPPKYTNIYAAMPSLHFGWDLLVGVALFMSTSSRVLKTIGLAMPVAMCFAVIATGNHWILDTIVGLLVVTVGAGISEGARAWVLKRRGERERAARRATRRPVPVHAGVPANVGTLDGKRVPALRDPAV